MTLVNLNKARKAKVRAEKKARADANAAKFGRTKTEKRLEEARREKARSALEGHKRDE